MLQEKAASEHHDLLSQLCEWLEATGWRGIEEIPAAIDLWASKPSGERMIFEAKTGAAHAEIARTRAAVAQLLEYRFFYGKPDDGSAWSPTDRSVIGAAGSWTASASALSGEGTAASRLAPVWPRTTLRVDAGWANVDARSDPLLMGAQLRPVLLRCQNGGLPFASQVLECVSVE